ncbi:MAG: hypothetical protein ACOZNI_13520 [Myxococcota bacterium]
MWILLAACAVPDSRKPPERLDTPVPALVEASVACDDVEARWTVRAVTDAWTGNGDVWLSKDGVYVETHPLTSSEAEWDGSRDTLELTLSVKADWRDVSEGSSTAFNCDEPGLAGVLRVFTRTGAEVADCRAFGEDPSRWATWDAEVACDEVLPEDTGVTTE